MINKIKLFIFSFLAICSIFSTASAVEFYGDKTTQKILSSYNWYTLQFVENASNYLWCIYERYKGDGNVKTKQFCEDADYDIYSTSSYSSALRNKSSTFYSDWNFRLWQKTDSNDVFWLRYFNIDGKKQYFRLWIKNIGAKSVKLNSKRWSAVYSTAFMDWLWFALTKKDWDQVRASQVVNNVFALDWFLLVARTQESYLVDTYTNKMYKYKDSLYPYARYIKGQVESIFPRIRDNVPSEVSDIQRWPLAEYKMYYNQSEYKSFDLKNTREATESDLNEIRENIKKSLVVFNQDALKLYRDVEWLDLSVWSSSDLPNNSWSNTPSTSLWTVQKKACIDYYSKMKAFTAHSDWCFGDWSNAERTMYRTNVIDGEYKNYNTRDKARYRRCWQFANYREEIQKQMPLFWQFLTEFKDKFLWLSAKDVDVNALCSHIQLNSAEKLAEAKDNSSIWKKIAWIWNGNSGDPLTVDGSWNALYQNDFQNELRALQPYYWQCKGYDKYWLKKLTNQTEEEKLNACKWYERKKLKLIDKWKWVELEYTNDSTVEWQVKLLEKRLWSGKGMLESVWSGVSSVLSEGWDVLLKTVKDPFYSGYNSVLSLQCSQSFRWQAMDYVLLWLFAMIAFYLFKTI